MSQFERDSVKSCIRIFVHMQPIMIAQSRQHGNLWDNLYKLYCKLENQLKKHGFSNDAIWHMELLGTGLYFKNRRHMSMKEISEYILEMVIRAQY